MLNCTDECSVIPRWILFSFGTWKEHIIWNGAYVYYLWKISKIKFFATFWKIVILGTWHIKKDYSCIVMLWGLRICKEDVVRKTLWERRCEKDVVRKTWERRWEKYVVRKTFWEMRCEKDVVRRTLWERRCEKNNPSMDFCWCSYLISYVFFFSIFNCCWSSGGLNQFHWSTCLFWYTELGLYFLS